MKQQMKIEPFSKLLGIHVETVRSYARRGALPGAYKFGGEWLVDLDIFMSQRRFPFEERKRKLAAKAKINPLTQKGEEI